MQVTTQRWLCTADELQQSLLYSLLVAFYIQQRTGDLYGRFIFIAEAGFRGPQLLLNCYVFLVTLSYRLGPLYHQQ
jgi:hypothetical protein